MKLSSPRALLAISVFMFGFGFLLVPLYSVFCEITGINGKTSGKYVPTVESGSVREAKETDREVTVQFVANHNANLQWPFEPQAEQIKIKLGERRQVTFNVVNPTSGNVVMQAIPSVSPSEAAPFLHKLECFCFQQQPLTSGEEKDLALVFFISEDLPEHVKKLTLSYTLFDITEKSKKLARSS